MSLAYTKVEDVAGIVARCRAGFRSKLLRTAAQRKTVLRQLARMLEENRQRFYQALKKDLNKAELECVLTEVGLVLTELYDTLDNLESWMKPQRTHGTLVTLLDNVCIQHDPLGTVLNIGAWNYPVQLALSPIVGAIAGGNTAVLKPSELSENTAALLTELLPKYVAPDIIGVVNGAVKETSRLLEERFDHIFYTGNGRVARIVMTAAAKNLTPVTLELGGKSPTIVDDNVDLKVVAQRIMWGRTVNAGQTCIAPDYILVRRGTKPGLIKALAEARDKFLGTEPQQCPHYCRIVTDAHYKRVTALLSGGKVVVGGECDPKTRFIAPTVLDDVDIKSPLMTDEIFGPLLPLIPFDSVAEAVDFVNERPKPLALYVFSNNNEFIDTVLENTTSGGVTVNDCLLHAGTPSLPFGGVGESGTGAYHGKHSFDCLTHKRGVVRKDLKMEGLNEIRYMPYDGKKIKWLQRLLQKSSESRGAWFKWAIISTVVMAVGMGVYIGKFLKRSKK